LCLSVTWYYGVLAHLNPDLVWTVKRDLTTTVVHVYSYTSMRNDDKFVVLTYRYTMYTYHFVIVMNQSL